MTNVVPYVAHPWPSTVTAPARRPTVREHTHNARPCSSPAIVWPFRCCLSASLTQTASPPGRPVSADSPFRYFREQRLSNRNDRVRQCQILSGSNRRHQATISTLQSRINIDPLRSLECPNRNWRQHRRHRLVRIRVGNRCRRPHRADLHLRIAGLGRRQRTSAEAISPTHVTDVEAEAGDTGRTTPPNGATTTAAKAPVTNPCPENRDRTAPTPRPRYRQSSETVTQAACKQKAHADHKRVRISNPKRH